MNLLSVDFDYFFPMKDADPDFFTLYDWGHRDEGKLWIETLWNHRASMFLAAGLPLPMTTGEEVGFWNRFRFSPTAELFFADSHRHAANPSIMEDVEMVVSFDAHHDGGYRGSVKDIRRKGYDCSSWLVPYHLNGANMVVVYPDWRKTSLEEADPSIPNLRRTYEKDMIYPMFDRVFVARSGGWTPSWVDPQFHAFMRDCPVKAQYNMGLTARTFNLEDAEQQAFQMTKFMEQVKRANAVKTMEAAS